MSDRKPILAKAPETSASTAGADSPRSFAPEYLAVPPDAQADEILYRIRTLLTDQSIAARRLAIEGAARFPEHEGLQNARRILVDGKAKVGSGDPEPSTKEEFDWLRSPPQSVRGKWVALVGDKLVASAETLAKLTDALRSKKLPKPALVHRID